MKLTANLSAAIMAYKKVIWAIAKLKRGFLDKAELVLSPEARYRKEMLELISQMTGCPEEEIITLEERLEITLEDIYEFYKALGFFPSPGYSIGIRHIGVEEVVECIRENLAQKTVKTVTM